MTFFRDIRLSPKKGGGNMITAAVVAFAGLFSGLAVHYVPGWPALPANIISVEPVRAATEITGTEPELSYELIRSKLQEAEPGLRALPVSVKGSTHSCTEYRMMNPTRTVPIQMTFNDRDREIPIAILDRATGALEFAVITRKSCKVSLSTNDKIEIVPQQNGIGWNMWATMYRINGGDGKIVLAVLFPLYRPGSADAFLYSPYGQSIAAAVGKDNLLQSGADYLTRIDHEVRDDLRARGVMSRAVTGTLVADVLPSEFAWRRPLLEQSDPALAVWDPHTAGEQVLGTLALNREGAYTQTVSSANAIGLYQFTDRNGNGTYSWVRRMFPEAGLIADFGIGARDHRNAVKAMILLDDLNLKFFMEKIGPEVVDSPNLVEYLAAAYNGGPDRVVRAALAKTWPQGDWAQAMTGKQSDETKGFIAKLRAFTAANLPERYLE